MRIIKKPKMPKLTCPRCGCVFKPRRKDLIKWQSKEVTVGCPICSKSLEVFKDKEQ